MFNHLRDPFYSCLEDREECFFADPIESFSERGFQAVPGLTLEIRQLSFDISKEEEVTWGKGRVIRRMGRPLGLGGLEKILRQLRIVRTCLVQVDQKPFQGFLGAMGRNVVGSTGKYLFTEERCVICHISWDVKETVDPVNGPEKRNGALFGCTLLFRSWRKLKSGFFPGRVTQIAHKEPGLASSDNPPKIIPFHLPQFLEKRHRKTESFILQVFGT
jgi:hypothetical protein